MIVYVLFVHKKSVSKRKVCIIFIKNLNLKNQKKTFLVGFFMWVFWVGFFIANPAFSPLLTRLCRQMRRSTLFRPPPAAASLHARSSMASAGRGGGGMHEKHGKKKINGEFWAKKTKKR
jgi:hypothetical protein